MNKRNKIIQFRDLEKIQNKFKKIILCHGVFDLLHVGHLRYFKEAKKLGQILVVSVTSDKYVNKGPGRPRFNSNIRMEAISSVDVVDFVVKSDSPTPEKIIKKLKPAFYVKGRDYKNLKSDITKNILYEKKLVQQCGGKLVFTNSDIFSSSKLIFDSDFSQFNTDQKNFINSMRSEFKKLTNNNLIKYFDNIKNFKILVIGETILDRYIFCETVGKSGKEPMLVLKESTENTFVGGAAAVASQISAFSENVTFLSYLGNKPNYVKKIHSSLKNIKKVFIKKKNSPTILKTRYVDEPSKSKIFGVYDINDEPLDDASEKKLNDYLKKNLKKFDVVVVSDYGHGFISNNTAKIITKYSNFLTINCQINANNKGHHSTNKYKNLNCVLINEAELRYEMRDNHSKINNLVRNFSNKIKSKFIIISQGNQGCLLYDRKKNFFHHCPAFATVITDKVGAGDSLLSIFSIMFYYSKSIKLSLLSGSLSASMSLKKFGNDKEIDMKNFIKLMSHIF